VHEQRRAGLRETTADLDAVDGRLLVVNDDRINVAAEDGGNGERVLLVSGLAEFDHAALDT